MRNLIRHKYPRKPGKKGQARKREREKFIAKAPRKKKKKVFIFIISRVLKAELFLVSQYLLIVDSFVYVPLIGVVEVGPVLPVNNSGSCRCDNAKALFDQHVTLDFMSSGSPKSSREKKEEAIPSP